MSRRRSPASAVKPTSPPATRPRPGARLLGRGWSGLVRERMNELCAGLSYRELSKRTGVNAETVRRYLNFGPPNAEFIAVLSLEFGVSTDWLLHGRRVGRAAGRLGRGQQQGLERAERDLRAAGALLASARAGLNRATRR